MIDASEIVSQVYDATKDAQKNYTRGLTSHFGVGLQVIYDAVRSGNNNYYRCKWQDIEIRVRVIVVSRFNEADQLQIGDMIFLLDGYELGIEWHENDCEYRWMPSITDVPDTTLVKFSLLVS